MRPIIVQRSMPRSRRTLLAALLAIAGFAIAVGLRDQFGATGHASARNQRLVAAHEAGEHRGYADRIGDRVPINVTEFLHSLSANIPTSERVDWERAFLGGYIRGVARADRERPAIKP